MEGRQHHARRALLGVACAGLIGSAAPPASAQLTSRFGTRAERGFGNRDAVLFSVENVLGLEHFVMGSLSVDARPMTPLYWGNLGVSVVDRSGFTFGGTFGASHVFLDSKDQRDVTLVRLRPRVGYAGSTTQWFGYWLRGGPSMMLARLGGDDTVVSALFGAEAYAVITPVPHLGLLIGPSLDYGVYTKNAGTTYEYGLSAGLFGEFW